MIIETSSAEFGRFYFQLVIKSGFGELTWTLIWVNRPPKFLPCMTDLFACQVMAWRAERLQDFVDRHGHGVIIEHLSVDRGWHSLLLRPGLEPRPLSRVIDHQTSEIC